MIKMSTYRVKEWGRGTGTGHRTREVAYVRKADREFLQAGGVLLIAGCPTHGGRYSEFRQITARTLYGTRAYVRVTVYTAADAVA